MALDELHARRLATVFTVLEGALDRMELLMRSAHAVEGAPFPSAGQIRMFEEKIAEIRARIRQAAQRFSLRHQKPPVRQALAAELSALWVVLENAKPSRMKGYGRKFSAADRADWEELIGNLLNDVEQLRKLASGHSAESGASDFHPVKE
jgi:hypothetical protein